MAVKRNSNSSKNNSNSAAAATKGAATESGAAAATEGGAGADFWTPTRDGLWAPLASFSPGTAPPGRKKRLE